MLRVNPRLASVTHVLVGQAKCPVYVRGQHSLVVVWPSGLALPRGAVHVSFRTPQGEPLVSLPVSGSVLIRAKPKSDDFAAT